MDIPIGMKAQEQCVSFIPNIAATLSSKVIVAKLKNILNLTIPSISVIFQCGLMDVPEDIGNFGKIEVLQYSNHPNIAKTGNTKS